MKLKYAINTASRTLAALTLALLATGCAAPMQNGGAAGSVAASTAPAATQVTAPRISVPATSIGKWYDLGDELAPWLGGAGAVPVTGPNAPTRAVGLKRDDGHWLAVVVVQAAASGGMPACPQASSANVSQREASGCLQMHRDADLDRWLQAQHAELWQWMDKRDLNSRPRAWVGERASGGGRLLEVHALVDPALIEAVTRNNTDFLAAGEPGQKWAQALAAATQSAVGGGVLTVPPFPYTPRAADAPPPVVAAPLLQPSRATQVPQTDAKPAVLAPRRDRE